MAKVRCQWRCVWPWALFIPYSLLPCLSVPVLMVTPMWVGTWGKSCVNSLTNSLSWVLRFWNHGAHDRAWHTTSVQLTFVERINKWRYYSSQCLNTLQKVKEGRKGERKREEETGSGEREGGKEESHLRSRGSFLALVSRSLCILGNDDAFWKMSV